MQTLVRRVAALLIVIVLAGVAVPGRARAGGTIGPRDMLTIYYNYINARQYQIAYNQWISPSQTYADFVAGYGDTSFVSAYFGGFQPGFIGGTLGRVPGVLIGYHTDGGVVAYSGCYEVAYNPGTTGIAQWRIADGDFQLMGYVPAEDAIPQVLDRSCYANYTANGVYTSAQAMLVDYFSAVNLGDMLAAYGLWAQPRQTYDNFVAGWATTTETVLFYGAYQFSGTYSAAESGRVPVVLFGYHTDGSMEAYQGCIGVSYNAYSPVRWSLWNAYLQRLPYTVTPDYATITAVLSAGCYAGT